MTIGNSMTKTQDNVIIINEFALKATDRQKAELNGPFDQLS
jgi:hypothetical protein